jgi:hypothetical protein
MSSHRSGRSFSVPVPAGVTITGAGFKDVDYHSGDSFDPTDWSISTSGGAVTWTGGTFATSANGNALRFATMYNFWFTADRPPVAVNASLGLFRPGAAGDPSAMAVGIQGPSAPPVVIVGDLNGDGIVNGADAGLLLANWGGSGVGDLNGSGTVDGADLGVLLSNWS